MKGKIIGLLVCLGILVLYCSGCGSSEGSVQNDQSPLDIPAADSPLETPILPMATATSRPSCLTLIEPAGNTVCGYVVSSNSVPIVGRPIFLAKARFLSDNSAVFAELDRQTAPQSTLDENGMFYMVNVQSDLYFVMIDDFPQPMILKEPDNPMNDVIADWRESEGAIDLGVITSYVYVTPEP